MITKGGCCSCTVCARDRHSRFDPIQPGSVVELSVHVGVRALSMLGGKITITWVEGGCIPLESWMLLLVALSFRERKGRREGTLEASSRRRLFLVRFSTVLRPCARATGQRNRSVDETLNHDSLKSEFLSSDLAVSIHRRTYGRCEKRGLTGSVTQGKEGHRQSTCFDVMCHNPSKPSTIPQHPPSRTRQRRQLGLVRLERLSE